MFKIIQPKEHHVYQQKIDALLGLFKIYHNFSLSSEIKGRATFIIAEDDKRSVYGGAVLYPLANESPNFLGQEKSETSLTKILSAFQTQRKEIWMTRICLCIGQDSSTSSLELIDLCESFYQSLYEELRIFKRKHKTGLIAFTLRIADTYNTLALQNWSFLYEIKLGSVSDGFFRGILDFPRKNRPALQQKSHKVLDFAPRAREGTL